MPDTIGQAYPQPIPDTESFAEEFIDSATRAGSVAMEAEDEVVAEEDGGPFIVLDDNGKLPPETEEAEREGTIDEHEGDDKRGANWAARGV